MRIEMDNLLIRSASTDDAHHLNKWWNDGELMEHAGFPWGLGQSMEETLEEIRAWETRFGELCIIEIDGRAVG